MRKITIGLLFICFFLNGFAQKRGKYGYRTRSVSTALLGIGGTGMSTWLLNSAHKGYAVGEQDYLFTPGFQAGLLLGYEFTNTFSMHVSGFYSVHAQKYAGRVKSHAVHGSNYDYTSSNTLNMIDIPLYFQYTGASGGYIEAGPMYSLIQKATHKHKDKFGTTSGSVSDFYPDSRISLSLGFGMEASLNDDNLFLKVGFRGIYTITDMLGVNALGFPYNIKGLYTSPSPTKAISGGVHLCFIFKPGY